MLVLGIETSCDETGVALYDTDAGLVAESLYSQVDLHARYGGVVPELASRDHIQKIAPLLTELLDRAERRFSDLDGVAFTAGPGLVGALLVGATVGRSLAYGLGIPAIGVHHMEAHLLAPLIGVDDLEPPFAALLVSGGHSQIVRVDGVGRYTMLGESLDDAAGEAFDKTAKMLGLGYPGGPAIARAAESGNPKRFHFPRPMTDRPGLDMSFSGLKTHTLNTVREHSPLDDQDTADIARAFEEAVVETLVIKVPASSRGNRLGGLRHRRRGRGESTAARASRRGTAAHDLRTARALHRQRRDDRLRGCLAARGRRARRLSHRDARALADGRTEGRGGRVAAEPRVTELRSWAGWCRSRRPAQAQCSTRRSWKSWKSRVFDVTTIRSLTQAMAAIWTSTKVGVCPAATSRARCLACQSAASRS